MDDFLSRIVSERREAVKRARRRMPLESLMSSCAGNRQRVLSLRSRLLDANASGRARIIAEIKRASPSEGVLRANLVPEDLACAYERAGATAVSVLTEPNYFKGSDDDLRRVKNAVAVPVLRKDFIVDPWQVYQSSALGADVILVIAEAAPGHQMEELVATAAEARVETIIEVRSINQLEQALAFPNVIVGVNSRDLRTMRTDLETLATLAGVLPAGIAAIAESGIRTRSDIDRLTSLGYRGFLVGTALLKAESPDKALAELVGE